MNAFTHFSFFFYSSPINPSLLSQSWKVHSVLSDDWAHSGDTKSIKPVMVGFYVNFLKSFPTPSLISISFLLVFVCIHWCVIVCVCACMRLVSSFCHHAHEGKVSAGEATCRHGTWEVVANIIGLFVCVFCSPRKRHWIRSTTERS